ncbi:uncharacterized protein SPPG_02229 [Spizellomyces punctatus DAOM BR117]|uniref:Uncharacterized protein n=1 Tax=Spizellomyces punctatus (strain DAOM BR117) TaxID=645134 RepID=A0A0L0HQ47_SPIPD|nr:uncharacterized protein SPPG_02229 [Spizellomyces punctatus DAOM BR117]KND03168.1 hypothetical protein SPPG_02229 [Spizellomyces punctatus DAOM BR117]|eukprot:XP_016611207.1 hypothetical protein SPPG_02229 [Spizellomyces punctatus DAOM BR117]
MGKWKHVDQPASSTATFVVAAEIMSRPSLAGEQRTESRYAFAMTEGRVEETDWMSDGSDTFPLTAEALRGFGLASTNESEDLHRINTPLRGSNDENEKPSPLALYGSNPKQHEDEQTPRPSHTPHVPTSSSVKYRTPYNPWRITKGAETSPATDTPIKPRLLAFSSSTSDSIKSLFTPSTTRGDSVLTWSPSMETPSPGVDKRKQTPGDIAKGLRNHTLASAAGVRDDRSPIIWKVARGGSSSISPYQARLFGKESGHLNSGASTIGDHSLGQDPSTFKDVKNVMEGTGSVRRRELHAIQDILPPEKPDDEVVSPAVLSSFFEQTKRSTLNMSQNHTHSIDNAFDVKPSISYCATTAKSIRDGRGDDNARAKRILLQQSQSLRNATDQNNSRPGVEVPFAAKRLRKEGYRRASSIHGGKTGMVRQRRRSVTPELDTPKHRADRQLAPREHFATTAKRKRTLRILADGTNNLQHVQPEKTPSMRTEKRQRRATFEGALKYHRSRSPIKQQERYCAPAWEETSGATAYGATRGLGESRGANKREESTTRPPDTSSITQTRTGVELLHSKARKRQTRSHSHSPTVDVMRNSEDHFLPRSLVSTREDVDGHVTLCRDRTNGRTSSATIHTTESISSSSDDEPLERRRMRISSTTQKRNESVNLFSSSPLSSVSNIDLSPSSSEASFADVSIMDPVPPASPTPCRSQRLYRPSDQSHTPVSIGATDHGASSDFVDTSHLVTFATNLQHSVPTPQASAESSRRRSKESPSLSSPLHRGDAATDSSYRNDLSPPRFPGFSLDADDEDSDATTDDGLGMTMHSVSILDERECLGSQQLLFDLAVSQAEKEPQIPCQLPQDVVNGNLCEDPNSFDGHGSLLGGGDSQGGLLMDTPETHTASPLAEGGSDSKCVTYDHGMVHSCKVQRMNSPQSPAFLMGPEHLQQEERETCNSDGNETQATIKVEAQSSPRADEAGDQRSSSWSVCGDLNHERTRSLELDRYEINHKFALEQLKCDENDTEATTCAETSNESISPFLRTTCNSSLENTQKRIDVLLRNENSSLAAEERLANSNVQGPPAHESQDRMRNVIYNPFQAGGQDDVASSPVIDAESPRPFPAINTSASRASLTIDEADIVDTSDHGEFFQSLVEAHAVAEQGELAITDTDDIGIQQSKGKSPEVLPACHDISAQTVVIRSELAEMKPSQENHIREADRIAVERNLCHMDGMQTNAHGYQEQRIVEVERHQKRTPCEETNKIDHGMIPEPSQYSWRDDYPDFEFDQPIPEAVHHAKQFNKHSSEGGRATPPENPEGTVRNVNPTDGTSELHITVDSKVPLESQEYDFEEPEITPSLLQVLDQEISHYETANPPCIQSSVLPDTSKQGEMTRFQTASGKAVIIAPEVMEASRRLVAEEDDQNNAGRLRQPNPDMLRYGKRSSGNDYSLTPKSLVDLQLDAMLRKSHLGRASFHGHSSGRISVANPGKSAPTNDGGVPHNPRGTPDESTYDAGEDMQLNPEINQNNAASILHEAAFDTSHLNMRHNPGQSIDMITDAPGHLRSLRQDPLVYRGFNMSDQHMSPSAVLTISNDMIKERLEVEPPTKCIITERAPRSSSNSINTVDLTKIREGGDGIDRISADDSLIDHHPSPSLVHDSTPLNEFDQISSGLAPEKGLSIGDNFVEFAGFKAASGKVLPNVSKEAVARAKRILSTEERQPRSTETVNAMQSEDLMGCSFETCLPHVSQAAHDRAKQLLSNGDASLGTSAPENPLIDDKPQVKNHGGFTTGSGQSLPIISKASIDRARRFLSENAFKEEGPRISTGLIVDKPATMGFPGFMSGAGKTLPKISRAAMDRANCILSNDVGIPPFKDDEVGDHGNTAGNCVSPMTNSASCKATRQPECPSHLGAGERDDLTDMSYEGGFGSFKTGGGKELPALSKAALEKAHLLWQQDESSINTLELPVQQKEKPLIDDVHQPVVSPSTNQVEVKGSPPSGAFVGFATGRGKALRPVSGSALKKAMSLLEHEKHPTPFDEPASTITGGFTSGGGKSLPPVSAAALKKAGALLGDDTDMSSRSTYPESRGGGFGGFTSGRGKALPSVSSDSLAKARALWVDNDALPSDSHATRGSVTPGSGSGKELRRSASSVLETVTGLWEGEAKADSVGALTSAKLPSGMSIAEHTPEASISKVNTTPNARVSHTGRDGAASEAGQQSEAQRHDVRNGVTSRSERKPERTPMKQGPAPQRLANTTPGGGFAKVFRMPGLRGPSTPTTPTPTGFKRQKGFTSPFGTAANLKTPKRKTLHPAARIRSTENSPSSSHGPLRPVETPIAEKAQPLELFSLSTVEDRKTLRETFNSEWRTQTVDQLRDLGITECILAMDPIKAQTFEFQIQASPVTDCAWQQWGVKEARDALIAAGGQSNLATEEWVQNHYRWIVWKLAAMVRSCPSLLEAYWNPKKVVEQMRYRYEREINRAQRSAVKLIIERDNAPSRFLVLCVADVARRFSRNNAADPTGQIDAESNSWALELTDGWYQIKAAVDAPLERQIKKGNIAVGSKLRICGAQLLGPPEPCPVLEATDNTQLRLSANGTRRAYWDARLGYQRAPSFTLGLRQVMADGGPIPCIDVVLCRRYAVRHYEKVEGGSGIVRTEKEEEEAARNWQNSYMLMYQKLAAEYERGLDKPITRPASDRFTKRQRTSAVGPSEEPDGEQLYQDMQLADDPMAFAAQLDFKQQEALRQSMCEAWEREQAEVMEEIRDRIETAAPPRNVTHFISFRVCDYPPRDVSVDRTREAMLTIWSPDEALMGRLQEGKRFKIYNLIVKENTRDARCRLYLKAQRNTVYVERPVSQDRLDATMYRERRLLRCGELYGCQQDEEVDLVVIILDVGELFEHAVMNGPTRYFRNLLCADRSNSVVVIQLYSKARSALNFLPNDTLCCRNLEYICYDSGFGLHKLKASSNAEIRHAPRGHQEREAKQVLETWRKCDEKEIQRLRESKCNVLHRNVIYSGAFYQKAYRVPNPTGFDTSVMKISKPMPPPQSYHLVEATGNGAAHCVESGSTSPAEQTVFVNGNVLPFVRIGVQLQRDKYGTTRTILALSDEPQIVKEVEAAKVVRDAMRDSTLATGMGSVLLHIDDSSCVRICVLPSKLFVKLVQLVTQAQGESEKSLFLDLLHATPAELQQMPWGNVLMHRLRAARLRAAESQGHDTSGTEPVSLLLRLLSSATVLAEADFRSRFQQWCPNMQPDVQEFINPELVLASTLDAFVEESLYGNALRETQSARQVNMIFHSKEWESVANKLSAMLSGPILRFALSRTALAMPEYAVTDVELETDSYERARFLIDMLS